MVQRFLSLICTMPKTDILYNEECFEERRKHSERKRADRMINELQMFDYTVVVPG